MATPLKFFHYSKHLISSSEFCVGHSDLDKYVTSVMGQYEGNSIARNYVGLNDDGVAVSFFTLNASRVRRDELGQIDNDFPLQTDLPTIKLGRMAVDQEHRCEGYGKQSLAKAIALFIEASKLIGAIGLTVDAKDELIPVGDAEKPVYEFYEKYGFKRLTEKPEKDAYPMILYISTVRKMFPGLFESPV